MQIRFGTDGVRGLANDALTTEMALAVARAAVVVLDASRVMIGRDTRRSGAMLEHAVAAGACAEGADVTLLGVVPTPAVAFAASGAIGIMISASHNPFGDNGIKIFADGGAKLTDAQQQEIEAVATEFLVGEPHPGPTGADVGVVDHDSSPVDQYVESLRRTIDGRTLAPLRVVVDCANGSNSELACRVLDALHLRVDLINAEPDGLNINANCGSTDPSGLIKRVVRTGADLGIAFDGDADRLVAVDHEGNVVDGDQILAICAKDLAQRSKLAGQRVVVTVMSNLGFVRAMEDAGIAVTQTAVGDRYVLEELNAGGYSLGGEQSGHIIFRDMSSTGDGLLASIMLMDAVNRSGQTLAECAAAAMTRLPQVLVNVTVSDPAAAVEALAADIELAEEELGRSGRVLVRASGTEPKVRIMVEAADEEQAGSLAERLEAALTGKRQ